MPHLKAITIEGKDLRLGRQENDDWSFGPDLVVKNCRIDIQVASRDFLLVSPVEFVDCTIHSARPLKSLRFVRASFRGCRFTGKFSGCDFGTWPEYSVMMPFNALFEDVDLTGAEMDLCRIFRSDMKRIDLPKWPSFAILEPYENRERIKRLVWKGAGDRLRVFHELASKALPIVVASLNYAPAFIKWYGGDIDSLRGELSKLDFVRM